MLIAQKIANLLNGVSQRPVESRPSSQCEVQENVLSHRILGLRRRPPTTHVAQLSASTAGYASGFLHEVRQSATDKYNVVVVGGDLKVFNLITGAEESVVFPSGKSYLTSTNGFKAFTVGDTTYIVNLDTTVRRSTKKATVQASEALVFVRQADYSTRYALTLDGITVTVDTPEAASPNSRLSIATDTLAGEITAAIAFNDQLNTDFSVSQYGSSIYIVRKSGKDFTIASTDGLADKGLKVIKGSVQTFADLPARAKSGMIVQVTGDPESATDNYWVAYTDSKLPGQMGVWVECAAPGTPVALDPTTMPWALGRKGTLIEGLVADDPPTQPTIVPVYTTAFTGGFTTNPDTLQTFTGDQDIVLTNNAERVDGAVSGADGTTRFLRTYFDVDTTLLDYGQNVTVDFLLDTGGGGGFIVKDSKVYDYGQKLADEILQFTTLVPSGSHVRLQITYGGDSTPEQKSRLALITIHRSSSDSGPGVWSTFVSSVLVAFNPLSIFPVGCTIALHVSSSVWTYTVATTDKTGAQVATALTALVSGYTATNPVSGEVTIANTSGAPVIVAISVVITQPPLTFLDATAGLSVGAQVGRTIRNLTDGSQGTITANGTMSVTVAALTGGISNTFHPGDVCEIIGDAASFVFAPAVWSERAAGDLTTCPLPSFVDHVINEVFFYQNRLGFTADEFVVLSQSGVVGNFMRQTATQLLASDVIDVKSAYPNASTFENAVEWDGVMYLFSGAGHQFVLSGDPIMSPQTVTLTKKSSFPMSAGVRPVAMGKYLYFGRAKSTYSQIMQYFLTINERADAVDITEAVPQYLAGSPKKIVGDAALEMLFVLTSGATDTLWVQSFHYSGDSTGYASQQETMSSWSKWTFTGAQIIDLKMLDGVLSLVVIRSDGVYLETLDLGVIPAGTADYRDRAGSGSLVSYISKFRFSTIFMRNSQSDEAETRGRLQLRYGSLSYHDTTDFTVTVTPAGRTAILYVFHSATAAEGDFQFPIETRNLYATIEVTSTNTGGFAFSGFDWEGNYTARAKRV